MDFVQDIPDELVVFDEHGVIIQGDSVPQPPRPNLEKDEDAVQMFETHELAGNRVKTVWHPMLTERQRTLLLVAFLAFFFGFAALVKYDVKSSKEKYEKEVQSRILRGCKRPTMIVTRPKEDYPVDPDEGCAPQ